MEKANPKNAVTLRLLTCISSNDLYIKSNTVLLYKKVRRTGKSFGFILRRSDFAIRTNKFGSKIMLGMKSRYFHVLFLLPHLSISVVFVFSTKIEEVFAAV